MHRRPDSYHTCYTLTGVSITEHVHYYERNEEADQFAGAFSWKAVKARTVGSATYEAFEDGTNLPALNPVYVIPHASVADMRKWSEANPM